MASYASDVLAVELLQREARTLVAADGAANFGRPAVSTAAAPQRVVPLFETLADLQAAGGIMRRLFALPWYRKHIAKVHGNHQEVMLGYSDSGKDAGRLAAAWALYVCQEDLVEACKDAGISLTLFHGRGGTVGRGGGPTLLAIQSQPPGSVQGSLRITEQGEMVQAKFGVPRVAAHQLELFSSAVLLATLRPPRPPRETGWRTMMDQLSALSCTGEGLLIAYFLIQSCRPLETNTKNSS
jgi:phosphoenolpyruvate carboxylase